MALIARRIAVDDTRGRHLAPDARARVVPLALIADVVAGCGAAGRRTRTWPGSARPPRSAAASRSAPQEVDAPLRAHHVLRAVMVAAVGPDRARPSAPLSRPLSERYCR